MNPVKALIRLAGSVLMAISLTVSATDNGTFSTAPTTNDGQRWRVGYYEGGEYIDYQQILTATIRGLMKGGWIEPDEIPEQQGEQTKALWNWLVSSAKSDFIEFVADAHYTANWNDDLRTKTAAAVIERLNQRRDIDLMIAMGTWAGQDLANDKHHTSTMVLSSSDPLSAGIIKSVEDSGYEHLHAKVDPFRYERQVRVFHDSVGFKRLGIAYEDTQSGRSYAGIPVVEKLSKERGFSIERCYTKSDVSDTAVAEAGVIDCFQKLAKVADAIYVTGQGGVNQNSVPKLVRIAHQHHIPTFSQSGSDEVEYGFLMSISRAEFKYLGEFHAETFAKVFNGAKPNQLGQLFEEPPKMALNLKTAEIVGFDPPLLLLGASDEIFHNIVTPK